MNFHEAMTVLRDGEVFTCRFQIIQTRSMPSLLLAVVICLFRSYRHLGSGCRDSLRTLSGFAICTMPATDCFRLGAMLLSRRRFFSSLKTT